MNTKDVRGLLIQHEDANTVPRTLEELMATTKVAAKDLESVYAGKSDVGRVSLTVPYDTPNNVVEALIKAEFFDNDWCAQGADLHIDYGLGWHKIPITVTTTVRNQGPVSGYTSSSKLQSFLKGQRLHMNQLDGSELGFDHAEIRMLLLHSIAV